MRLLATALLLLVWFQQPNPAVPTAKSGTHKGNAQETTSDADYEKTESPSPVPIDPCAKCPEAKPQEEAKTDKPYDAGKDTLYRAYLWFTMIGVAGAIGGVIALAVQTFLFRRNTIAAEKAAIAADRSANAVMDAEGAILSVNVSEFYLLSDASKTSVSFRIHNVGRTVATSFAAEHLLQVNDEGNMPPIPSMYQASDESARSPSDYYIPVDESASKGGMGGIGCVTFLSTINEPMMGLANRDKPFQFVRLTETEENEIATGKKFLWAYGFVRYRDIFKRRFEMRFCHRYEPKLMPTGGFVVAGPTHFNRLNKLQ
jgi:hypothetical protein